jgi:hypothetical protein
MDVIIMSTQSYENVFSNLDQKVEEYLGRSGNCVQTTFLTLQDQFRLEGGEIFKALTPFPGIALRGEKCGRLWVV